MSSPIYRYGQPIELDPGWMPSSWVDEAGGDAESWEDYQRRCAEWEFATDVMYGIANAEQYQELSVTFDYDPIDGAFFIPF